jgi:hypothetical protein
MNTPSLLTLLNSIATSIPILGLSIVTAIAQTMPSTLPQVPKNLQVPNHQTLLFKTTAKGSQIYVCQAKAKNSDIFKWDLKAPTAELFDEKKQHLGSHYAGPTWEANDGSKVVGKVKAKANAPQATAIPWLLLESKSNEGNGLFSGVNWIQRINTKGGKAPKEGCDRAHRESETQSAYTADYYFYGNPSSREK